MWSYWPCASPGISQRRTGSRNHFVCSAEKLSVDIVKITPDQTIAGHHAHSHATQRGVGVFARISDKLGAGRGLRHGCGSTVRIQLFLNVSERKHTTFSACTLQVSRETDCDPRK